MYIYIYVCMSVYIYVYVCVYYTIKVTIISYYISDKQLTFPVVSGGATHFFTGFIMFVFAGFQIHSPSMLISVAVLATYTIEYMLYIVF